MKVSTAQETCEKVDNIMDAAPKEASDVSVVDNYISEVKKRKHLSINVRHYSTTLKNVWRIKKTVCQFVVIFNTYDKRFLKIFASLYGRCVAKCYTNFRPITFVLTKCRLLQLANYLGESGDLCRPSH
jgi:hypothetical protein